MNISDIRKMKTGEIIGTYCGNVVTIENTCGTYLIVREEKIPLDSGRGRDILSQLK